MAIPIRLFLIKLINKKIHLLIMGFLCLNSICLNAQNNAALSQIEKEDFFIYRGYNVAEGAFGSSVINGDYADPLFEIFFRVGYKRYIIPYLNVNFTYNKFNLAAKDTYNEGFMSFDINVETTLMPYNRFSPHIYIGGGLNAANYFKQSDPKLQAGVALEYIASDMIGLKIFSDYNHVFSDLVDGKELGEANDVYWRMGLGVNFYFGGKQQVRTRTTKGEQTIINSSPIIQKNK